MRLDAGVTQQVQLVGEGRLAIDADHRSDAQAQTRQGERPVRHRAAEPPAARIVCAEVTRGGAGDEDQRLSLRLTLGSIGSHGVFCEAIPT